MSDLLNFQISGGVGVITLNRPDKLNAFTPDMLERWLEALENSRISDEVRVIVITGTGRAFTTGGDIGGFDSSASQTPAEMTQYLTLGAQRLIRKITEIEKPVIAALNGFATGGGLDIALACDLRYSADTARFAETYARMGLIPGMGGAWLLPRIVGTAKAYEMFWSCDWVDAQEAERIGLVSRVVPESELMETTLSFARKVAAGAPLSIRTIKKLIRQGLQTDLNTALDIVAATMPVVRTSEDHREAIAAFREKRCPAFKGR